MIYDTIYHFFTRTKNNLLQWLTFFLVVILETSQNAIETFNDIIRLRVEIEETKIISLCKRIPKAELLLKYLYTKPIVAMNEIAVALDVSLSTAHRLLKDFECLGLLNEKTGFKRNRIFVFEDYLKIFEK